MSVVPGDVVIEAEERDDSLPPEDAGDGGDYHDDEPIGWVTVAAFASDPLDAHLAKIRLVAHQIPCFIADEYLCGTAWHYALAIGGTKVKVPQRHVAAALSVLREPPLAAVPDCHSPSELPLAAVCPHCGSGDVRDVRWTSRRVLRLALVWILSWGVSPIVAMILPVIGIVAMATSPRRRCNECGSEFERQDSRRGFEVVTAPATAPHDTPDD